MWRLLLAVLAGFWLAGAAGAAEAATSTTLAVEWTAPTTNDCSAFVPTPEQPTCPTSLTDLAAYRVYVTATAEDPCPQLSYVIVPSPTSAPGPDEIVRTVLTDLIPSTAYRVQVTAVDQSLNESRCSVVATASTLDPVPPSNIENLQLSLREEPVAVVIDTDAENVGTNTTTVSVTLTVGNNPNRALVVRVGSWDGTASAAKVSSIDIGGVTTGWTKIAERQDGGNNNVEIWRLRNPGTGSITVDVNMVGTCDEVGVNVLSLHTVDQTTSEGTPAGADGSSSAPSLNVSAATGDLVVDALYYNNATAMTVGAGQTAQVNQSIVSGSWQAGSTEPGAATVTMSWTGGAPSAWVQVGIAIKAASAGAFEIDAQPGSYSLTGSVAGAAAGRIVNAVPGAYTLTGAPTGLAAGRVINAQPGAYSLTGAAAGLLTDRVLDAQPGVYALTGASAALLADRLLSLEPGAYTLVGAVADLVYVPGGAFELNAEPGSYGITGAPASTLADRFLNAAPGGYVIVGPEAILVLQATGEFLAIPVRVALRASQAFTVEASASGFPGRRAFQLGTGSSETPAFQRAVFQDDGIIITRRLRLLGLQH